MSLEREKLASTGEEFGEIIGFYAARSGLVKEAVRKVDRALFVPEESKSRAYTDEIITLSRCSTISQPSLTVEIIDHVGLTGKGKVLEVGTASGYSTAILSHLADEIHTMEIDEELADSAKKRLKALDYGNVYVHARDGGYGYPESAPYDGIVVTASARAIPKELFKQLAFGGHMVVPIGEYDPSESRLAVILKINETEYRIKKLQDCFFVPFVSDAEGCWPQDVVDSLPPEEVILELRSISYYLGLSPAQLRKIIARKFNIDPADSESVLFKIREDFENIIKLQAGESSENFPH